jgi:hypothetical protein
MLELAGEKPIKPYALARTALYRFRELCWQIEYICEEADEWDLATVLRWVRAGRELEDSSNGWPASPMITASLRSDELTIEQYVKKMLETGREPTFSPHGYGDDLIHIKRLGNKLKDLLDNAKFNLFTKNFPKNERYNENFSGYCPTEEEIRQEALWIIERLRKGSAELAHQAYLRAQTEVRALEEDPLALPE